MINGEELLSAEDAAKAMGVSYGSIRNWYEQGKFPRHEDAHGRGRFKLSEVRKACMEYRLGPYRGEKGAKLAEEQDNASLEERLATAADKFDLAEDVKPSEEQQEACEAIAPEGAARVLRKAIRMSRKAFEGYLREQIIEDSDEELHLLRVLAKSPTIFEQIEELLR